LMGMGLLGLAFWREASWVLFKTELRGVLSRRPAWRRKGLLSRMRTPPTAGTREPTMVPMMPSRVVGRPAMGFGL